MKITNEIIELYGKATEWAMQQNHVVGKNNDYYITLYELQEIISMIYEKDETP